ncbi:hypothetical protein ACLBWT_18860 [Paenibacillus sp. D51F]
MNIVLYEKGADALFPILIIWKRCVPAIRLGASGDTLEEARANAKDLAEIMTS